MNKKYEIKGVPPIPWKIVANLGSCILEELLLSLEDMCRVLGLGTGHIIGDKREAIAVKR